MSVVFTSPFLYMHCSVGSQAAATSQSKKGAQYNITTHYSKTLQDNTINLLSSSWVSLVVERLHNSNGWPEKIFKLILRQEICHKIDLVLKIVEKFCWLIYGRFLILFQ